MCFMNEGRANLERCGQLADARRATPEAPEHRAAGRVGQGLEDPVELWRTLSHVAKGRPAAADRKAARM